MKGQRFSLQRIVCATLALASCLGLLFFLSMRSVLAEQLPVRVYTTADGLPRDLIQRIIRDSHGFLWFCTGDGLSRFNGYEFTTYGVQDGLPHPFINDLIETRRGVYWVATNGGGVARFNPSPLRNEQPQIRNLQSANRTLFTPYPVGDELATNNVNVLYEDRKEQLWAGTDAGLFHLEEINGPATFRRVALNMRSPDREVVVRALVEDREGTLWVSTNNGLLRRLPDGRTVRYTIQRSSLGDLVTSLMYDTEGRLWVGHRGGAGLIVLKPEPATSITAGGELLKRRLPGCATGAHSPDQRVRLPDAPGGVCQFTTADGLAGMIIGGIAQFSDGRIWIATSGGLTEFMDGRFRSYTSGLGVSDPSVRTPVEDRDGNLWLGSLTGATKITWNGFTSFGTADGLGNSRISSIIENERGELCAMGTESEFFVNRFDGRRFAAVVPQFRRKIKDFGWGSNQLSFQDHTGEWWVPTGSGLYRFPRVTSVEQLAHTPPKAIYSYDHGELPGDDLYRLFEDSHGDVWISIASGVRNAVVRWERANESFHLYSEADGLPPRSPPTAYCEDAANNLWLGFYDGGLARYHDGSFRMFTQSDGVPAGLIRALYLDHAGRLWVATDSSGVARLDDPQTDHPHFITYTIADGLASNTTSCITEDKLGRMYFGTTRSLDRFDPETKRIRHYTKADGLASNAVRVALRDRDGALWFGTEQGISRLIPPLDAPPSPPPILISGLRIAGATQPISALGSTEVAGLVLNPTQNQLSIDFVGLGFAAGEGLKYQYKLVGANEEWSTPSDQRTINYASLSPGRYQFQVRALTADGSISPTPATITFTILSPIWQRWWFIGLGLLTVGLVVTSVYRYRVRRLIELERVRTRIATDLHDDIGASLSLIAMLSEVAQRQVLRGNSGVAEPLASIASSSRELVDSMSDIVWAVNPSKDRFSELVKRMRRFASEAFTSRDIALQFEAPDDHDFKLGADARREIFFIVKEGVNNITRHSGCTEAAIILSVQNESLQLELRDNGKGFVPSQATEGNGMGSMRQRASRLGGEFEVVTASNHGTILTLVVPMDRRRWKLG